MTSPTHLIPCPTATYLQVHWNFHNKNNNNNRNDPIPHTRAPAPSQLQSSPPQPPPQPPPKMGSYEIGTKKPTRVDAELQSTQFHNNPTRDDAESQKSIPQQPKQR
jgi:hypothetical protein